MVYGGKWRWVRARDDVRTSPFLPLGCAEHQVHLDAFLCPPSQPSTVAYFHFGLSHGEEETPLDKLIQHRYTIRASVPKRWWRHKRDTKDSFSSFL